MSSIDTFGQTSTSYTDSLPHPVRMAANATIIGLWLWLYRPVLDYLAIIFSREDFRTNQLMLASVVVVLIVIQVHKERDGRPGARGMAVARAGGGDVDLVRLHDAPCATS